MPIRSWAQVGILGWELQSRCCFCTPWICRISCDQAIKASKPPLSTGRLGALDAGGGTGLRAEVSSPPGRALQDYPSNRNSLLYCLISREMFSMEKMFLLPLIRSRT